MRFTLLNSHQFLLGAFLIKNALSADFITKGSGQIASLPLVAPPPSSATASDEGQRGGGGGQEKTVYVHGNTQRKI